LVHPKLFGYVQFSLKQTTQEVLLFVNIYSEYTNVSRLQRVYKLDIDSWGCLGSRSTSWKMKKKTNNERNEVGTTMKGNG